MLDIDQIYFILCTKFSLTTSQPYTTYVLSNKLYKVIKDKNKDKKHIQKINIIKNYILCRR